MPYIFINDLPENYELPEGFETVNAYSEEDYNNIVNERDNLQNAFDKATNDILSLRDDLKNEKAKFAKAFLDSNIKKSEPKTNNRKVSTVDNIWG